MKTYSQVEQDLFVLDFLNYKTEGFFLDIGAHNGISLSNTYLLEKEYNWNGLCVELNKELFKILNKKRTCFKSDLVITNYNGKCDFNENDFLGHINNNNGNYNCTTIEKLLKDNSCLKIIDYFSLDVEGHEYEILNTFLYDEYEFKVLTVEHNKYVHGEELKNKIYNLLNSKGYTRIKEDVLVSNLLFEDWYIKK